MSNVKVLHFIGVVVLVIIILLVFLRLFEKKLIFFPYKKIELTPQYIGLNYEDIYFKTNDNVKLNGWFVPIKDKTKQKIVPTILFCHGNAGNISHRIEILKIFNEFNYNIFIFDYRGYGRSDGSPSEEGTYLDAVASYNYLISRDDIDKSKIVLYGKSLGGAIAIDLATRVKIFALITEASFTSTVEVGRQVYPIFPVKLLVTQKFDALSKIGKITVPKLIIHSTEDEIIPFNIGKKLFEKAVEPKEFMVTKGGHNDSFLIYTIDYMKKIGEFLNK